MHWWSEEQFTYALEHVRLTETNKKVLQAFMDAEEYTLTAHSLAEDASLPGGWTAANLRMGELSKKFEPFLGALEAAEDGDPHWWRYTTTGKWQNRRFHWTLRPELRAALLAMGWKLTFDFASEPDIIPAQEARRYFEGAVKQVLVNSYERDSAARQECISKFGTLCQVCKISLVDIYGELAEGYIQIHHLLPLSEIGEEYEVNPLTDLIPVCPNCHAMLHRRSPPLSPEELRRRLRD